MKSSQSNFNLRLPDSYSTRSYLIATVPQPHPISCQYPLIYYLAVAANSTVKDDKPKWTGWGDTTACQPQTNGKVSLASIMKSEESAHDIRGMKQQASSIFAHFLLLSCVNVIIFFYIDSFHYLIIKTYFP